MIPDPCITPVCNTFVDIIQRHTNYLIYASNYVENLKNKGAVLGARKDVMNARIEDAERRSQGPSREVVVWKEQVDNILRRIDEVVHAYETRSCLCAICSDYKTGLRSDEMIKEVDRLLDGGNQYLTAEMVDCDNSEVPLSMPYVLPESLDLYCQEALKCIKDDNSKENVVGVWGMGGVGKTTLFKKIHNSCIGCPMFSHVIWIVASSQESNIFRIQNEIIKELKLKSDENDDVQAKARVIYNFLWNKNFILFIDDLWDTVDLYEEAGVPNPYEEGCGKNRKVVFTTRSEEVCGKMEARKIIEVKCLNSTQSWDLFKGKVGERILSNHRVSEFAKDVVEECKGLPLALITIGHAMSTKSDPRDWKYALELMKNSQGHDIFGTDKLLSVLKISYDFLPSEDLRKCFLSISLWPEDHSISKEDLIACWMGLDIIDNFASMDDAFRIGRSLIGSLLAASLLENEEVNGGYTNVKMHDILRDLAVWIASDCGKNKYKWMVKAKTHLQSAPSLEVEWSEAEYISLMDNGMEELPSWIPSCPHLLTLMLQENQLTSESILSSFHNFQSLKYLDLHRNGLYSFPESICELMELQYLNLSFNYIENIPENLRNLKKLKYLILRENCIHNVPKEVFTDLVKLIVLDLFSVYRGNSLVNVEELKWLEKKLLYLGISVRRDEEFSKLLNMSDLRIVALTVLYLRITSFNFMSIIPNPYCLRELGIRSCDGLVEIIFEKKEIHQHLPSLNLESLELVHLEKLERIIWK